MVGRTKAKLRLEKKKWMLAAEGDSSCKEIMEHRWPKVVIVLVNYVSNGYIPPSVGIRLGPPTPDPHP